MHISKFILFFIRSYITNLIFFSLNYLIKIAFIRLKIIHLLTQKKKKFPIHNDDNMKIV